MVKYIIFTDSEFAQDRDQIESYDLGQAIKGFPIGIFNDENNTFLYIDQDHATQQAVEEHLIEYYQARIGQLTFKGF